MINKLYSLGKFLDQPMFISQFEKKLPLLMAGGGAVAMAKISHDVFQKTDDSNERRKLILSRAIVLTSSIISALMAPKVASKVANIAPLDSIAKVKDKNKELIDAFIKKNKLDSKTLEILNKAKEKTLSFSEVEKLLNNIKDKAFLEKLIPDPVATTSKDIIKEIGYLSTYGAVPVVGGVIGGVAADKIAGKDVKKTVPDKVKEGAYQYLANIFMCNIGAAMGLGALEAMHIQSKAAKAGAMIAGIILTGVIGGSKIANFISKNFIDKIAGKDDKSKERTPEPLDLFMHTDDIATVSVLSGLKWIEPALPILYSVSGYRAGIGYRN